MSKIKKRSHSVDDTEEPPLKRILQSSSRPTPAQRKQHSRKCKKVVAKPPLNICDLPTELLEKIIGNINIWHHNRIRATCRRLKDANDVFVMHEFQKAAKKYASEDPKGRASAALSIIRQATEVYVRSGFESTFCGCILPMLRSSYRDPFCPQISEIKKFLVHFYGMVTDLMGDESSQRWRLLYTITLMGLIKRFDKSLISSTSMPLHWRIVVELRGPWLGTLWTLKGQLLDESRHRCNLLIMLSQMLMANITGHSFKNVWQCPSEVYVFGYDTRNRNHLPMTLFTFTVYGANKICNLFRLCLADKTEEFQWPSKWPNDQFTINLDILCKEATKWGCSKSQHMEIGPFSKRNTEEENDQQDST